MVLRPISLLYFPEGTLLSTFLQRLTLHSINTQCDFYYAHITLIELNGLSINGINFSF